MLSFQFPEEYPGNENNKREHRHNEKWMQPLENADNDDNGICKHKQPELNGTESEEPDGLVYLSHRSHDLK